MSFERRREISILFGDPNRGMRMQYRAALRSEGFTRLHEFDTLENFPALFKQAQPDLVFMDAAMPAGDATRVVHALRHGELSDNPFVPVIVATWDASRPVVRRIIDSGADDILVKPLSTQAISGRIQALASGRKPFVVTADYIGPDRRRSGGRSDNSAALLAVPNPLRAKLDGVATNGDDFLSQVASMRSQISRLRLRAAAFRIAFAAGQLGDSLQPEGAAAETAAMLLDGLLVSAMEIHGRTVDEADQAPAHALCDTLLKTARPLAEAGMNGTRENCSRMTALQEAATQLLLHFHPDRDAHALAADVAAAIARFRTRQTALASGALPAGS
ncbi:response regulator [Ferrovibrio sp.]|uniref:response regulator n=1 Tax=Ferrovibrio sp. TaxID=1917215 RepID=UPI00311F8DB1